MPLVVLQTTLPGSGPQPFRITEVLNRIADSDSEALDIAAIHLGGDREATELYLTVRWHSTGAYWLVHYEPAPEVKTGQKLLLC